jgi:hypothetical protein
MQLPFWSDEERPFVLWALGITVNFKFIARKLGLVQTTESPEKSEELREPLSARESRQERLRRQIEASKYEEKR